MKYNITYQSSNFEEWFDIESVKPVKIKPVTKILPRDMHDSEILKELQPQEITLSEFAYILDKKLINKNDWFISYIKDRNGVTRAVSVFWDDGNGWRVNAYELENGNQWVAGAQVISRKFLSDSEPKTLLNTSDVKVKCREFINSLEELYKTL